MPLPLFLPLRTDHPMPTAHLLNTNLRTLRIYKRQSQRDVADALHVSRSGYSGWEQGIAEPSLDNLLLLRHHFNVKLEVLLLEDLAALDGFDLQRVVKSNAANV